MEDIAARFILLVSGIFVVVDPIGTIPLMMSLTGGHSQQETRAVIRRASFFSAAFLLLFALVLITAIAVVFFISYVILRASLRVQRLLGANGLMVLGRVMGLFLAAMAVQFVFEGAIKLAASFKT